LNTGGLQLLGLTAALVQPKLLAATGLVVAWASSKARRTRPRVGRVGRRLFSSERGSSQENEDRWEKQREKEREEANDGEPELNEVEAELAREVEAENEQKEKEAAEKAEQLRLKAAQELIQLEIDALVKENEGAMAKCQRLQTEYDNLRRRCRQELSAARDKAAVPLVEELLEIPDTFALAKDNTTVSTDGEQGIVDRFDGLFSKMLASWNEVGAHKVEALGHPFDPKVHEAVSMIPSNEYKEDIVCNELRAGWVLKSDEDDDDTDPQVLRPSLVCVSAGPGP